MADTTWDEVGQRFAELGRQLQDTWRSSGLDASATADLKDAGEKVKVVLDGVADSITRAANAPEVREAAKSATTSVADAIAASIAQLTKWMEQHAGADTDASTEDEPPQTDAVPDDEPPQDDAVPDGGGSGG